ncbi:hypothetical protein HDV02_002416 [Globomyces sp. JEL0801]|nr:hypothetical protein HDV02_002416 [Globomyces sp. JEL0801]
MLFQIASDVHIESYRWTERKIEKKELISFMESVMEPVAPNLILAGDIGCPGSQEGAADYELFLHIQSARFERVFVVTGNHEYYSKHWDKNEIDNVIQKIISNISRQNVYFLNNRSNVIPGSNIRLIGTTLWSMIPIDKIPVVSQTCQDYRKVHISRGSDARWMTPEDTIDWHLKDLKFIRSELEEAKTQNQTALVITHHAPLHAGVSDPQFRHTESNSLYSTDLTEMIMEYKSVLAAWIFGHTHWQFDYTIGGVRIVANQYGYTNPKGHLAKLYLPKFAIEVNHAPRAGNLSSSTTQPQSPTAGPSSAINDCHEKSEANGHLVQYQRTG